MRQKSLDGARVRASLSDPSLAASLTRSPTRTRSHLTQVQAPGPSDSDGPGPCHVSDTQPARLTASDLPSL